jgi:hypothetical protein
MEQLKNKKQKIKEKVKIKSFSNFIFLILFFFSSCSIFRHSRKPFVPEVDAKVSKNALIDSLKSNYFDFKTLKIKFEAEYQSDEKNQTFSGTLKMKKDSFIWISLSPAMGIEAARIYLTSDSLKYINRFTSEYFSGNYDFIAKNFQTNLSFTSVQSILINQPVIDDNLILCIVKSDTNSVNNDSLIFQNICAEKDSLNQILKVSEANFKIQNENLTYGNGNYMNVKYSDFKNVEKNRFPYQIDLFIKGKKHTFSIKVNFKEITINVPLKANFSIPKKYLPIKMKSEK